MPILILNVKHTSELVILILTIFGVYFSIKDKRLPIFEKQLKMYSYLVWGFFLSIVFSVLLSTNPAEGIDIIGSNVHFLVAPFVAYSIYKSNFEFEKIILAIKISVLIGFSYAIYQSYYLGLDRAEAGADASTIFAFIMIIFAFFSIIDIWKQSNKARLFSVIIFLLALYSVVLSGTRISWVMFIILIPTILFIWYIQKTITKKTILLIFLFLFTVLAFAVNNAKVNDRIATTINEVKLFDINEDNNTSVGLRLKMWASGIEAFKHQPFIGYGYHNVGVAASQHVYGDFATDFIANSKMLHNDYINSLVGFGILGLFTFLALLFFPLIVFLKRLKQGSDFTKNAMGVIFMVSLLVFSITDSIYSHNVMRSLVVFLLALLLIEGVKSKSS